MSLLSVMPDNMATDWTVFSFRAQGFVCTLTVVRENKYLFVIHIHLASNVNNVGDSCKMD